MIAVYIASPYTKGDVAVNVKAQIDCADELISLGFAPFAPLYSHFQHMHHPRPYEDWAAALRLLHDDKTANEKLRMAAGFYMDAGEHGMAQKCKMLIVTE